MTQSARSDGGAKPQPLLLAHIRDSSQHLDLWKGVLSSNFTVRGGRVRVTSVADDESTDTVAVEYTAPAALGLTVQIAFCAPGTVPQGSHGSRANGTFVSGNGGCEACDWNQPADSHLTTVVYRSHGRLDIARKLEYDEYSVSCVASVGAWQRTGPHSFVLSQPAARSGGATAQTVAVSCRYALGCCVGTAPPKDASWLSAQPVPQFAEVRQRAEAAGQAFWQAGAFVDLLSGTRDRRAAELERIAIQSMYLLRAMETGAAGPQESGLLFNSWSGKHHQEMRLWHSAWLPVWGRQMWISRSWGWFLQNMANATSEASRQGYKGQRVHKSECDWCPACSHDILALCPLGIPMI